MASYYLHHGSVDIAARHLALALDVDKDLFKDFDDIFPFALINRKIRKLLENYNLI